MSIDPVAIKGPSIHAKERSQERTDKHSTLLEFLNSDSADAFFRDFYGQRPLWVPGSGRRAAGFCDKALCEGLIQHPAVEFLLVQEGKFLSDPPQRHVGSARTFLADGYTW